MYLNYSTMNCNIKQQNNHTKMKYSNIPKVGEQYNHYDDGKIRKSRHYMSIIQEVIPFSLVDREVKAFWDKEVKQCDWLYSPQTDYFIKAELSTINETVYYVRTINGRWFSLGWWAGLLDVDGTFTEKLEKETE